MKIADQVARFEEIHLEADARAMFEADAPEMCTSWDRLDVTIKDEYRRLAQAAR